MFKKPTVFSDESGSQVLGKDGSIKASFSVADHGASHEGAAVSHLQQNFDDYMAEEVEQVDEISSDMAHRYLKGKRERDYDISADGKSSTLKKPQSFGKMNKDMKSTARALRTIEKAKKTNEEVEQIDELSKDAMLNYLHANKHKNTKDGNPRRDLVKSMRGTDMAVRKYTGSKSVRVAATEEVEQMDELSKETLGSYIKKASGAEQPKNVMSPKNLPLTKIAAYQGDSETGHFGKRFNQATYDKAERLRKNRETGITRAADKLTKEGVDNPYAVGMAAAMKSTGDKPPLEKSTITKAHKIAKEVMKENKFLTGALKKLEEGRGRPAKEGSAAWHRQQAAASAGKPKEEPVALGMQLRKAASINSHVEFDDGKKHEIHPKHITAFNDHMAARRTTQDKAAFQKKASASHDAFVKAVSEPTPAHKDSGDYGMPKYR